MLLDTHVCLWLLGHPERLGLQTTTRLTGGQAVFFSAVSIAEIEIKRLTGRLDAPPDMAEKLDEAGLREIQLNSRHSARLADLPEELARHDPFDRLLLAQARVEEVPLCTADRRLLATARGCVDARD